MPGDKGNFSLAGHSSYLYNEVFNDLYKVKLNDKIIIKTVNDEFTYKITDIFETDPKDVSVLEQNMDKKEARINEFVAKILEKYPPTMGKKQ